MITKNISVPSAASADLKTLMETAGHVFADDNDMCTGLTVQIAPAEAANTVDVMSEGETVGITLSNADGAPTNLSFKVGRLRLVYLLASADTVDVKVLVERTF